MAKIIKKGFVIPFDCGICECSFVVGIHLLRPNDGNFYYNCPTCGNECHTDVAKIPAEYHEAVEIAVKRSENPTVDSKIIKYTPDKDGWRTGAHIEDENNFIEGW